MAVCGSTNNLKIQEYSCFNGLTMNHAKQLSEENTQLLSMKQLKHQWKVCLQRSFIFLRKKKDLWIPSPIYLLSRIRQALDNTGI